MLLREQTYASIDALPDGADGLFTDAGLFCSRLWWRTTVACAMPNQANACFLLYSADETPVALFPLCRPARGSALASLTTPYTCLYKPLLAPELDAGVCRAVFAAFARFCRGWATTRLDALPEDWPALPACLAAAHATGLAAIRFAHFGNWHEDVSGLDWSGYLARRPGALRETIRRRLRRAERRDDTRFSLIRGGAELEAGIAAYEHVYARSWKPAEQFPDFNPALIRATAAAGLLRLGLWWIGEAPVAAQFWVVERGAATVLKLAHDEAFEADSPGTVLTALTLRTLLDGERVSAIDFGRGDDAYKQGWAGQRRQRIGLLLANPRRPAGLMVVTRHRVGRLLAMLRPGGRA